jgi:uncharacterized protein (TIGR02996 family)
MVAMSPIGPLDFAALHRAILEDPDDDAPRLALATWYERNGKRTRGELFRDAVFNWEVMRGPLTGPFDGRAIFRRGLVEAAVLDVETFLEHGSEIFGNHPITHVEFVDLDPGADLFGPGTWGWITGFTSPDNVDVDLVLIDHDLAVLPDLLANAVEGQDATGFVFTGKVYATKDAALEELSRTAVRVGREAAGLPPLVGMWTTITAMPGPKC